MFQQTFDAYKAKIELALASKPNSMTTQECADVLLSCLQSLYGFEFFQVKSCFFSIVGCFPSIHIQQKETFGWFMCYVLTILEVCTKKGVKDITLPMDPCKAFPFLSISLLALRHLEQEHFSGRIVLDNLLMPFSYLFKELLFEVDDFPLTHTPSGVYLVTSPTDVFPGHLTIRFVVPPSTLPLTPLKNMILFAKDDQFNTQWPYVQDKQITSHLVSQEVCRELSKRFCLTEVLKNTVVYKTYERLNLVPLSLQSNVSPFESVMDRRLKEKLESYLPSKEEWRSCLLSLEKYRTPVLQDFCFSVLGRWYLDLMATPSPIHYYTSSTLPMTSRVTYFLNAVESLLCGGHNNPTYCENFVACMVRVMFNVLPSSIRPHTDLLKNLFLKRHEVFPLLLDHPLYTRALLRLVSEVTKSTVVLKVNQIVFENIPFANASRIILVEVQSSSGHCRVSGFKDIGGGRFQVSPSTKRETKRHLACLVVDGLDLIYYTYNHAYRYFFHEWHMTKEETINIRSLLGLSDTHTFVDLLRVRMLVLLFAGINGTSWHDRNPYMFTLGVQGTLPLLTSNVDVTGVLGLNDQPGYHLVTSRCKEGAIIVQSSEDVQEEEEVDMTPSSPRDTQERMHFKFLDFSTETTLHGQWKCRIISPDVEANQHMKRINAIVSKLGFDRFRHVPKEGGVPCVPNGAFFDSFGYMPRRSCGYISTVPIHVTRAFGLTGTMHIFIYSKEDALEAQSDSNFLRLVAPTQVQDHAIAVDPQSLLTFTKGPDVVTSCLHVTLFERNGNLFPLVCLFELMK